MSVPEEKDEQRDADQDEWVGQAVVIQRKFGYPTLWVFSVPPGRVATLFYTPRRLQ